MSKAATATQTATPPAPNRLADAVKAATEQAATVQPRTREGVVVAGPYAVGGMGEVSVVERASQKGDSKYLFAEYTPSGGGRIKAMPLAAVAALAKELPSS